MAEVDGFWGGGFFGGGFWGEGYWGEYGVEAPAPIETISTAPIPSGLAARRVTPIHLSLTMNGDVLLNIPLTKESGKPVK